MIGRIRIISPALAVPLSALLQSDASRPRFEVASIKSCADAAPGERGGGPTAFSPDTVMINDQFSDV